MERRNSIRAAIQGLLTPVEQSDGQPIALTPRSAAAMPLPAGQVFGEIQAELREHGIGAELHEIAHAVLEAVAAKPALCKGLFAEYMLDES